MFTGIGGPPACFTYNVTVALRPAGSRSGVVTENVNVAGVVEDEAETDSHVTSTGAETEKVVGRDAVTVTVLGFGLVPLNDTWSGRIVSGASANEYPTTVACCGLLIAPVEETSITPVNWPIGIVREPGFNNSHRGVTAICAASPGVLSQYTQTWAESRTNG